MRFISTTSKISFRKRGTERSRKKTLLRPRAEKFQFTIVLNAIALFFVFVTAGWAPMVHSFRGWKWKNEKNKKRREQKRKSEVNELLMLD